MTTTATQAKRGRATQSSGLALSEQNDSGVSLIPMESSNQYLVQFEYNPRLVAHMRRLEGAEFDKDSNGWVVPATHEDKLPKVLEAMRGEVTADVAARADIERKALTAAGWAQKANGTEEGVKPHISNYHKAGEASVGEMLVVNGHWAAQLTGFGNQDGAAFVKLHRVADLSEPVFQHGHYAIKYSDKGRGEVNEYEPAEQRQKRYQDSLGRYVDGVKVREIDGQAVIEFDYNPALAYRVGQVVGAEFDTAAKAWMIPLQSDNPNVDMKDVVARTVDKLRTEYVADKQEREALNAVAQDRIDGAKVSEAFTKEGTATTGKVLAVGQRYVLQHTGKEYTALHRARSLDRELHEGQNVRIEYGKAGRGTVAERSHAKANER
jgi:hypothetical protein